MQRGRNISNLYLRVSFIPYYSKLKKVKRFYCLIFKDIKVNESALEEIAEWEKSQYFPCNTP